MGTTDLTKNATDQQEGIHMSTSTSNDGSGSAARNGSYSGLPNKLARAANGIDYSGAAKVSAVVAGPPRVGGPAG